MEKNYNSLLEGRIIVVNNFSFYNGKLDHAWNTGRICIVVYSDDEYEYVSPITHQIKEEYKKDFFFIDETNFQEFYVKRFKESTIISKKKQCSKNNNDIEGYIDLRYMYKLPIAYRDEIGKIDYQTYLNLKNEFQNYHQTNKIEDCIILSLR